jgi:hypothetical protein
MLKHLNIDTKITVGLIDSISAILSSVVDYFRLSENMAFFKS